MKVQRILQRLPVIALAAALVLPAVAQEQKRGGQGRYDQQIQKEVTKKLGEKEKFRGIRAAVEDGIVNLEGTVDVYIEKEMAEKTARKVEHVAGVRNLITVSGKQVPDSELREKLAEKLRYDRIGQGITFNNLTLGVNNGVVTIGGNVRDHADKASALAIVETTPGVKDVVDNIEVAPLSGFDDEIRIRVARAIYGDPVLQRYALDPQAPIRIVVEGGKVTLYGVVDSVLDSRTAEIRARGVPGVFGVTNKLVVASQQPK